MLPQATCARMKIITIKGAGWDATLSHFVRQPVSRGHSGGAVSQPVSQPIGSAPRGKAGGGEATLLANCALVALVPVAGAKGG